MPQSRTYTQLEYQRLSDEDVVYRFVHRYEQQAVAELYRRYAHLITGLCLKYLKDVAEAEDAVQTIFIKMLDDLPRFQIKHFKPWLYQVARNHCLMQLRKTNRIASTDQIDLPDMESAEEMHLKIEEEGQLIKMEEALNQLNEEQSACIRMFYYEKKNYADIAALRGISIMKVKSAIQNGKRNLKILMTNKNGR